MTGVAPGSYTLEVTINSGHVIEEEDYMNNTVTIPGEITAS